MEPQILAEILKLNFAGVSSVSKWFWGNSCRWTTVIRTCAPNLIRWVSQLTASPKDEFWYLSFCLQATFKLSTLIILFYCTVYLIKGHSVSHCEECLSYFCGFMIKVLYVTASASLQRGSNTRFSWNQVEHLFFTYVLYRAWW